MDTIQPSAIASSTVARQLAPSISLSAPMSLKERYRQAERLLRVRGIAYEKALFSGDALAVTQARLCYDNTLVLWEARRHQYQVECQACGLADPFVQTVRSWVK